MYSSLNKSAYILVLITFLIVSCNSFDALPKKLQIKTSPQKTFTGFQNISICFADCISCQNRTGSCERCFAPWFQLVSNQCVISSNLTSRLYTLQSTQQEKRFQNFLPSAEWNFNLINVQNTKTCNPDPLVLNKTFKTLGPFGTGRLAYQRTISQHNYFTVKFLLILSNWTSQASLKIQIQNEGRNLLSSQTLNTSTTQIENANKQKICSEQQIDIRVSIALQVVQTQTSQIFIYFTGLMPEQATWSLSSFVLVTGLCNSRCVSCNDYSPKIQKCQACRNFLAHSQTQKCSVCQRGFYLDANRERCIKCPIQFMECQLRNGIIFPLKCNYQGITNVERNCTFNSSYFDIKQLTQTKFYGSLFSIQDRGSFATECGLYSVVGPASIGGQISRTFLELPPHIAISLTFNLFTFNQINPFQRFAIKIKVDGEDLPLSPIQQVLNITGTSAQCSTRGENSFGPLAYNGFLTFSTQKFLKHQNTRNVKIMVSLGTSSKDVSGWGIRDMRIVLKRCDQNCQICTDKGCQMCKGLFQLINNQCTTCVITTGKSFRNQCIQCPQNCMSCASVNNDFVCTQCMGGYFLYSFENLTSCLKNPNFGSPLSSKVSQGQVCPFTILQQSDRRLEFNTVTNAVTSNFEIGKNGKSLRKNIQFYLMKIGDWEGDYLDIYANGLLLNRSQFRNQGGPLCNNPSSNDSMYYHQYDIQDDSQRLQLQFESVRNDPKKDRKFAVAKLLVYPHTCIECNNYKFIYKTQYNYDQRLFMQMAFNLVYENKDPQQFKNIFRIKVGQRQLKYDITANDSIRYWLRSEAINQSEIFGRNVSVQCLYPLKVTTTIPINGSTSEPIADANRVRFFQRFLQTANTFQNTKTLDNSLASVFVERYSPLNEQTAGVLGTQQFFSVITRIVIYLGLASFIIGCQTPCTHVMHNFQKLWVHIYVASLTLSPVLKTALWGFRQSQDQNIAINPRLWQAGLPKYLYYDAPAQYQHYYHDITFFRNIYNVGVAFAILTVIFIIFHCIFRNYKNNWFQSNPFLRHMKVTFGLRPLFYFNSIIFYQYFTVVLACCLQFLDLKTRTNQSAFAGVNAAACIIAFIFATLYPIVFHIILNLKRRTLMSLKNLLITKNRNKQYDNYAEDLVDLQQQHVIYNNKYSQIFYRFLGKELWNEKIGESDIISQRNFFYNIFRFGDLWWHAIVVILLHYSPFAQAFLLLLTNGFHLAINIFSKLDTTKYFRTFKSLQLVCFIVIQIMIIVMASRVKQLTYDSYGALGIVSLVFVFFIVFISLIRFVYTGYRLYKQYDHNHTTDPRMVIRHEKAFSRGWIRNPQLN